MTGATLVSGDGGPAPALGQAPGINRGPALLAFALLILGALWIGDAVSARQAVLYLLGGALGVVLYHAAFGFTHAFRVFLTDGRGAGIRAQMVMLAVACTLFFPTLDAGQVFGQPVNGILFPIGTAVVAGAVMFGIGMQVAGGCGSGTLYTAGGGSTQMLLTLVFFVIGATVGAAHLPWWNDLPRVASISLVRDWGWAAALAANLSVFALIAALTLWWEKRRHGAVQHDRVPETGPDQDQPLIHRLLRGRWPMLWGAVALALLSYAMLLVAGRPWGITSAFTLWGSRIALPWHEDILFWEYWADADQAAALEGPLPADVVTVTNIGLMAGAMLAASLAGRFAPTLRIPPRLILASVVGGLLLGYGARIGTGCNISAYFGAVASGSLHGWVWLPAALVGNWIGLKLRPFFR
ncbi:MAG: hypothetical protein RLY86_1222 [Pseudomonadota bacterium]|jgi:uncharacterized membrane protein YedE/YeeE